MNDLRDETLCKLIADHPRIFKGQLPALHSHIPKGWEGILRELLTTLEAICTADQLSQLTITKLLERNHMLILDGFFDCDMSEEIMYQIGAKALISRNWSIVTCIECGVQLDAFPENGHSPLCQRCG